MAILAAYHLAKSYKKRQIIKDVSLEVHSKEVVGLLGPNGAGKTTCFYMIVGLIPQDEGSISIDNHDISSLPMHGRAKAGIGYLPQEPSIFRRLTVSQNILSILEIRTDLNQTQRLEHLGELLADFNIEHIQNSLGMSLSGGERRRVEIARALASNPKFILLDEPFAGVDPISVADIQEIIRHLKQRGLGVLITDHNVRETLDICEKAYIVSEGTVLAQGSPSEVLADKSVRQVYLGQEFKI